MVQWLTFLLLFICITNSKTMTRKQYQHEDGITCSKTCICFPSRKSAVCNFTQVDQLNLNISVEKLTLNKCYGQFDRSSWDSFNTSALTYLKLYHCNVSVQETHVLTKLTSLKEMLLIGLREDVLKNLLIGINKTHTQNLYVAETQVQNMFKNHTFYGLKDSKVSNITLANIENLTEVHDNYGYFKKCKIFRLLYLQKLININFQTFTRLTYLYMEDANNLNISYCKYNMTNLNTIKSVKNNFNNFQGKYECLPNLKRLYILETHTNEHILQFPANFLEELTSLQYLQITAKQMLRLKLTTLSSESLLDFRLESFNILPICNHCTVLNFSKLVNVSLVRIDGKSIHILLKKLPKLEKLILNTNPMSRFPNKMLKWFPNLKELSLNGNFVLRWLHIFYPGMKTLMYLDISNTKLAVLRQDDIPSSVMKTLKKLDVSYNPFSCDCESQWFRSFIQKHRTKIKNIDKPNSYICRTPVYLFGKEFLTNHVSDIQCNHLLEIILPCTFFVVLVIIIVILFKNRWYIKYMIYMFCIHKKTTQILKDFKYDAFVIYCDEDRDWVHNTMVSKLENQNNFKLCIHFRNFEVGKFIIDNIVDSMNQSKKVILVLSKEFLKSDWCQLEMKLSQDRMLREGPNILVLIILENLKNVSIKNKFISSVMNMVTYAEYNSLDIENSAFWSQIIKALTDDSFKNDEKEEEINEKTPLL